MQITHELRPQILAFLNYIYAPAIGFFYIIALIVAICTLRKAAVLSSKRRSMAVALMIVTASSYPLEALYVYRRSTGSAPQHAVFRAISVTLVWAILAAHLSRARILLWNPYVGVFVLGFLFEITASLLAPRGQFDTIALCFNIVRPVVTFLLSTNGILVILSCRADQHIHEEAQSLLGHANVDTTQQQRRRIAEPDNWIEYLQGFTIFIPHLLPWHDPTIVCSPAIRIVIAILNWIK